MAAASEEMRQLEEEAIPAALTELGRNQETVQQIADFCRDAYGAGGGADAAAADGGGAAKDAEVFAQTRDYAANALLNVAYHVQNVAGLVTQFVALQRTQLDSVTASVRLAQDRMRGQFDRTGSEVFRTPEAARPYARQPKLRRLEGDAVPEDARPLPKYTRGDPAEAATTAAAFGAASPSAAPVLSPPPPLPTR